MGAVTILFLVALVLAIVIGVGFSILSFASGLFLPETGSGHWAGMLVQLVLSGIEMILGSMVAIGLSASLVSLVRSEVALEHQG